MNRINDDKYKQIIEEQASRIRLLTDLTQAGSWALNYAPDGSLASVQWGDGFRRLMGYSDQSDFPNDIESFERGIYPEDRDALIGDMTASAFDENIMSTTGYEFRFYIKDGSYDGFAARVYCPRILKGDQYSIEALPST
jgi:PAS domain-containing protein